MDVLSDESRLRQLFDDMTASQPDLPPARSHRIRARARRHRINQLAGGLAVVLAAAGIALGLTAPGGAPAPASRPVPSWALPWPDHRNGSLPRQVLRRAVTAWRHQAALSQGMPLSDLASTRAIWYVGQTAVHGQVVVVMFETDSPEGRRLVAGWATASDVMRPQNFPAGVSPWVLYDVPAPRPSGNLAIGLNFHGTTAGSGRNPDNWIAVLAGPEVSEISFSAPRPTAPQAATAEAVGIGTTSRGLLIADTGQLGGPVQLTALNTARRKVLPAAADVGVPGAVNSQVPQLAFPGTLRLPRGFRSIEGLAGQGDVTGEVSGGHGRLTVVGRCYGPASLRIVLDGGRRQALGTIPCDDLVHELVTSVSLGSRRSPLVGVVTSGFTSFRVALGTQG
jgi:hypothetical protein